MDKSHTGAARLWRSYRFPLLLVAAILLGAAVGVLAGEKATVLRPLGDLFLNLMFTAIVPLVFATVAAAVGSMADLRRLGKILGNMLLVFAVTGLIAGVLITLAVVVFPPAAGVVLPPEGTGDIQPVDLPAALVGALTVSDFPQLLSRQAMLALILFSILFGSCVSACGGKSSILGQLLRDLSRVMLKLIGLIMLLAPAGLFAYFACLVGEYGPQLLGAYGHAMLIYYPLCVFYFLVFYPLYALWAGGREGVRRLRQNILPPTLTALATQSSVATIPVNLEASRRIGIPADISEIILPIGATLHMDGTVFASILKIALLFGLYGREFRGLPVYASALVIAAITGVVMSGVPGGGLVGEMLIISLYGFPPEAFPIIATIGFLVDPPGTCINVAGDTVASMMVCRLVEGKHWLARHPSQN